MNKTKGKQQQHQQQSIDLISDEEVSNQELARTNLDLSLLRKPIVTSITGFEEVLKAYEEGTNELKKLLSRECDIIYECKVCRNIFRSLANFISHKRVYCRNSFNTSDHFHFRNNGFMNQDVDTIIQAEQEINSNPNGAAHVVGGADEKTKDLSGIIERLLWKQHQNQNSNITDFYDQIQTSKKITPDDTSQKSQTLKLNRLTNSKVAVYQSLQLENENSNMKDEINEVRNMLAKSTTVLGPDGKVVNLFGSADNFTKNESPSGSVNNDLEMEHSNVCKICKLHFETEKTLKLHLEMKHLPSTYVYQCPSCPQKFSQPAAVYRHLSNDHKKSNRRIRLMRDNIIKKRVRADEVVTKVTAANRELNKLQMTNNNNHSSNNNSSGNIDLNNMDNSEWQDNDLSGDYHNSAGSNTCPSCFKKFERKAVYTTHISTCFYLKNKDKFKVQKKIASGTKTKDNMQANKMLKSLKISLESEENSNASEGSSPSAIKDEIVDHLAATAIVMPVIVPEVNKRKRKRTNKIKKEEAQKPKQSEEGPTDDVDWDLDDEEEKKKINNIKKEINDDEYSKASALITDQSANTSSLLSESSGFLIKMDVSHEQEDDDELFDDDDDSGLIIDEKAEDESIALPTPDTSTASIAATTSTSATAVASTTAGVLSSPSPPKEKKNKESKQLKCNLCEKTYKDEEKLKYHMSFYHKRQKRFKCTLCEYQGYRRKDTMNHLNYVHNIDGTKETLEAYMESVIRSVDDESLQKQSILKKKQIQMKKQKQREKVKLDAAALKGTSDKNSSGSSVSKAPELKTFKPDFKLKILPIVEPPSLTLLVPAIDLKSPTEKPPKASRKSRHSSVMLPPDSKVNDDELKVPKFVLVQPNRDLMSTVSHSEGDESSRESSTLSHRRLSVGRVCKDSSRLLSTYGKIMKSPTSAAAASGSNGSGHGHKDASTRRPIRNRIKPVNKDFVYDLSDLLKKDNDAYREGSHLRLAGLTRRREFSTNSRDILDDSLFPEDIAELIRAQEEGTLSSSPLASGASSPLKNEDGIPYLKDKLMRPAFNPPTRPVQLNPSASPSTSTTPEIPRGPAYKVALEAFNKNSASMFEPQFLASISFNQMPKTPALPTLLPIASSTPSAASSILQKYFNAAKVNVITPIPIETLTKPNTSNIFERESKSLDENGICSALSPEQLCQKFELFNVTSISENELDIQDPVMSMRDVKSMDNIIDLDAVKKECSNDGDEDVAKLGPDGSATVSKKVMRKKSPSKKTPTKTCRPFIRGKRGSDKRKYGGNGQRRLTVMQRLQENKIRKSREQLFKRMLQNRRTNSSVYNYKLFNEA